MTARRAAVALLTSALLLVGAPALAQVPLPGVPAAERTAVPLLAVLAVGQPTTGRPFPVAGHLLSADGEPLPGEQLELHETERDGPSRLVGTAVTDDSGAVLFAPVRTEPADLVVYELRRAAGTPALRTQTQALTWVPPRALASVRPTVVSEDGALRVSFQPGDGGGNEVTGYEVAVGDRRTTTSPDGGEVLFTGLTNGTPYPVSVRPVTSRGLPAEDPVLAAPREGARGPSEGEVLCGRVSGRDAVVRGPVRRLCAAGLDVPVGARLTLDASGGPLLLHADGAAVRVQGDLRTAG
ncbi:MAG: fibronectin type protein, partial [Frankiales bacterium]|nr:fibronectin type protein [Frankiales bacterium]